MGRLSRLIEPFWTREFVANHLWKFIGVVTLGLLLLAGVLDFDLVAELVIVVGWFLLLPIFLFFGDRIAAAVFDGDDANVDADGPLDTLRDRYARGEITEVEFERRVERLLKTESFSASRQSPHEFRTESRGSVIRLEQT